MHHGIFDEMFMHLVVYLVIQTASNGFDLPHPSTLKEVHLKTLKVEISFKGRVFPRNGMGSKFG